MAKHALFALSGRWDELELAIRLAKELASRQHDVSIHGPAAVAETASLDGIAFHEVDGDDVALALEAATEDNDSVLVVDLLATVGALGQQKKIEEARKNQKLIALDPWDIGLGAKVLDVGKTTRTLPKTVLLTDKRLVPAPGAAPDTRGAFRAAPDLPEGDPEERRARARRALGVKKDERVLLVVTGNWQTEHAQIDAEAKMLVRRVPKLLGALIAELGDDVRVVHSGPARMEWPELGDRYTWVVPAGTRRTHNRFAAADALLTLDVSASALAWAVTWRVPSIAIINSCAGDSLERVRKDASFTLTDRVEKWLEPSLPLRKFRAWPVGLHACLEPAPGRDLPYLPIELLDDRGFCDGVRAYLSDASERKRAKRDLDAIAKQLANLPTGGDLWETMLAG
jgi:hypothetical protein